MNKPQRITKPIDFLYRRFNRCWTVEDMDRIAALMEVECATIFETEPEHEMDRVLTIMIRVLRTIEAYE